MKAGELHIKLAEKIRGDSKYLAEVTAPSAVKNGATSDIVEANLAELVNDNETFGDIKTITGPTGKVYYYSNKYMTETYARILARVKADDPCITIAETVREESRVYPRVTNVEQFKYALWKVDRDQLDTFVKRTVELNDDIKCIVRDTGSVFLYSDKYLTPLWAEFLAKKSETPDA